MLCNSCGKDKRERQISKKKGICYVCLLKLKPEKYRLKVKAKKSAYFKKWYEEKGRKRRVKGIKKNYSDRNKRIYQLYMDQSKHLSMGAISKMFHITPPRVHKIIKNEEKKLKDVR